MLRELDETESVKDLEIAYGHIFDAKTQGYDYHNYILAIALLIESRFPLQAVVHGEISKGQMRKAAEWANTLLEHPIRVSDRAEDEKLYQRLKREIPKPKKKRVSE